MQSEWLAVRWNTTSLGMDWQSLQRVRLQGAIGCRQADFRGLQGCLAVADDYQTAMKDALAAILRLVGLRLPLAKDGLQKRNVQRYGHIPTWEYSYPMMVRKIWYRHLIWHPPHFRSVEMAVR